MLGARLCARPRRSPITDPYLGIEIPQSRIMEFDDGAHIRWRRWVNCAALPSPDKMLLPCRGSAASSPDTPAASPCLPNLGGCSGTPGEPHARGSYLRLLGRVVLSCPPLRALVQNAYSRG